MPPLSPIFSLSCSFWQKLCRIVGWRPLSAVVAPTLGNFGSVTGGGNIGDGLNFVTREQTFSLRILYIVDFTTVRSMVFSSIFMNLRITFVLKFEYFVFFSTSSMALQFIWLVNKKATLLR